MTKQQKEEIIKHIHRIDEMNVAELGSYYRKWFMAKQDLDQIVFNFVIRGMDIKMAELKEYSDVGIEVVMSELREGET